MKVLARGKCYSGARELVVVKLSSEDKRNITNMHEEAEHYISFPSDRKVLSKEQIELIREIMKGNELIDVSPRERVIDLVAEARTLIRTHKLLPETVVRELDSIIDDLV